MVKNKKDMWSWVSDERIIEKFKKLYPAELIFFLSFVFLYSIAFVFPEWIFFVLAILLIFRIDVALAAFNFPKISSEIFRRIDKRVYFLFFISCIVSISVILFSPGSFGEISSSIKIMANRIELLQELFSLFKEEILYRLLFYYSANRFFGRNIAFFATLTLFSFMHHGNSFYYPFAVLPAGFLFSLFAIATGSILSSFLLHLIFNIIVYIFAINFL